MFSSPQHTLPNTAAFRRSPATRAAFAVALTGLTVGLLAGCGSSSSSSAAAPAASAAPMASSAAASPMPSMSGTAGSGTTTGSMAMMIHISSFKFSTPVSVAPGSTVSIMNMDSEAHTVTADTGKAFDVKAPPGKTVTFTAPTTPGSCAS